MSMGNAANMLQQRREEHLLNRCVRNAEAASQPASDETTASRLPRLPPTTHIPDRRETDERIRQPKSHHDILPTQPHVRHVAPRATASLAQQHHAPRQPKITPLHPDEQND